MGIPVLQDEVETLSEDKERHYGEDEKHTSEDRQVADGFAPRSTMGAEGGDDSDSAQ